MNPFHDGSIQGVYVIHVRHFTERAAHIRSQMDRLDIPFEFIELYDADQIDDETRKTFLSPDAKVSINALSCSLKHMEALRRIVGRGQKWALVLEDDVILHRHFDQWLARFIAEAQQLSPPFTIQIGSGGNMFVPKNRRQRGRLLYEMKEVRAADSYLIGAETARLRLDWIARHKIAVPLDHLYNLSDNEMKIPIYWTHPTIVDQGSMNGMFHSALDSGRGWKPRWYLTLKFLSQRLRRKYLSGLFK